MFASPTGLHVDVLRFSFIKLGYILKIPLIWSVIFLQSWWTSTGYFSNSTGSFVTNCRFSPIICGELEFTPSSCSCRMTQKLFVPVNYSFIARLPKFQTWSHVGGFVYKICGIFHVISSNPRIWWSLSTCQPCHSPNQSHLPAGQLERERGPGSPWKK